MRRLLLLLLAACTATEPEPETTMTKGFLLAAAVAGTWTATGGTVTPDGLYTAGAAPGAHTVAFAHNGFTDTARVCVAGVVVTPDGDTLAVGDTLQVNAAVTTSCLVVDTSLTVTWLSADEAVATVVSTGTQRGRVTAVAPGLTYVYGTWNTYRDSVLICVLGPTDFAVTPTALTVADGATGTLAATDDNCSAGGSVTWVSRNPAFFTVTTPGATSTITGVSPGSAYAVATRGLELDSALVTVTATPPASGSVSCTSGCRYVATTGSDAAAGTEIAPWRTIQKGVNSMSAGDTLIVEDGVYTGSSGSPIASITRVGTSSAWFTIIARTPLGAALNGQSNASTNGFSVASGAKFVRIEGFEVYGIQATGIVIYGSGISDIELNRNEIHDVGRYCYTGTNGRNAIFIGASSGATARVVVDGNQIHDIGRYSNGESGCTQPNTNWQNHDHGVYVAEANAVTIRNNLFWDNTHGWAVQRYNTGGHVTAGLVIANNTFSGENPNRDGHITLSTPATSVRIENNIFYNPRAKAFSGTATMSGVARNNLVYDATLGGPNGLTVSGTLIDDPDFVNLGTEDFHLQVGSPAIDAGVTLTDVTTDLEGTERPQGSAHDRGAYER
jgi:uncharacterized protein YjdB